MFTNILWKGVLVCRTIIACFVAHSVSGIVYFTGAVMTIRCGPSAWGLGVGLTILHLKKKKEQLVTKCYA
jgi:hypothetical protein